ncbi:hypothetical protein SEA_BURRO_30 [Microbacterium phage Burro]|uniref:Uncharacterized protein n=1 Tax=Microbacterium phage Burro TaxID=2315703 RepID=A0A386KNT4_9CAUD|nr:hypothetical protein HWB89_gp30 [Microbacterium phage Burro]AYD86173.1 hypothetical protein SEA_BURRO_30 [Microbacterium phage Burro]
MREGEDMDQLIEVLTQIQDLAGVAIDALTEAAGGGGAPEGAAPPEGGGEPAPAPEPPA